MSSPRSSRNSRSMRSASITPESPENSCFGNPRWRISARACSRLRSVFIAGSPRISNTTGSPTRAARARLGQAQLDLGEIINEIGIIEDSIINFEQARDNIEQVVREVPGMPEYRFLLARTRCFLANRYDKASRPDDARKAFEQALSDFEHLARANPQDRRYRANQAEALQLRADFLWDHGDLDGSRRDYLASIAIGAALALEDPDDLEVMDKHAASLNNLSILFGEAGQWEERTRTLAESTALRERLVAATPADDPRRERFLSNLGSCYGNLGTAHLDERCPG